MKVLIACEESQAVCIAFRELGHEAYSCDILDCSGGHPEWHIKGDAINALYNNSWDLAICHPPCTYLSGAGNGYFNIEKYGKKAEERKELRELAATFFLKMFQAPVAKLCIENPVGYMNSIFPPSQVIHPYMFGDLHKKRTCLWLKGLPLLKHVKTDDLFDQRTHVNAEPIYIDKSGKPRYFTDAISGGKNNTQEKRSKTFPGIAKAMAEQWGGDIREVNTIKEKVA